jgi:membrane-associated protease RseP (regulator of RpoE activity)
MLARMTRRELVTHIALFATCCATTFWYGILNAPLLDQPLVHWVQSDSLSYGAYFAGTLMGILVCHEAGHYILGRHHGVDVSLPYFIPLPPQISLGTLGAVIRMDKPISDRNQLFDVGASGPLAGLAVAVPLLVVGLSLSTVGPQDPSGVIEGNSILYALLKYAVFGEWLPGNGRDVQLHPMAFAGWVGLLITMINLLPIGQLDGGHVARAVMGQSHERLSRRLHVILPIVGVAIGTAMFAIALGAGRGTGAALRYASYGVIPWTMWAVLLAWMRRQAGEYHPPVGDVPLDASRRRAAIVVFVVFLLIATPVPFRPVL